MRRAQGEGVGQDHGRDQVEARQRVAEGHEQHQEDADRDDEPALNLVGAGQVADVGRFGVGAGDPGGDLDTLVLAQEVVEAAPEGQDLVHRVVGEDPVGLGQVDPGAVAVGRDVGGEALEQLGMLVHGLVVDEESIQGAAADRIVEDLGDLAMRAAGALGDLRRRPRRRGSVRGAGPPAGSRLSACPRPSARSAGGRRASPAQVAARPERAACRLRGTVPGFRLRSEAGLLAQGFEGAAQRRQVPGRRHRPGSIAARPTPA